MSAGSGNQNSTATVVKSSAPIISSENVAVGSFTAFNLSPGLSTRRSTRSQEQGNTCFFLEQVLPTVNDKAICSLPFKFDGFILVFKSAAPPLTVNDKSLCPAPLVVFTQVFIVLIQVNFCLQIRKSPQSMVWYFDPFSLWCGETIIVPCQG